MIGQKIINNNLSLSKEAGIGGGVKAFFKALTGQNQKVISKEIENLTKQLDDIQKHPEYLNLKNKHQQLNKFLNSLDEHEWLKPYKQRVEEAKMQLENTKAKYSPLYINYSGFKKPLRYISPAKYKADLEILKNKAKLYQTQKEYEAARQVFLNNMNPKITSELFNTKTKLDEFEKTKINPLKTQLENKQKELEKAKKATSTARKTTLIGGTVGAGILAANSNKKKNNIEQI